MYNIRSMIYEHIGENFFPRSLGEKSALPTNRIMMGMIKYIIINYLKCQPLNK